MVAQHKSEPVIEKYYEYSPDHFILREALPEDDPENVYNWFKRNYPNLDPKDYGIKNRFEEINYSW